MLPYVILLLAVVLAIRFILFRKPKAGEPVLPAENVQIPLETVDGSDCLVWDGGRYYAYAGADVDGGPVWDWHGRMGDGIGFLTRAGHLTAAGELYRLREGSGDLLLAYLPEEGWPITDMQIMVREGASLPEIAADGFAFGEVYRIEGEFPEEELEKVCDLTDPARIAELAGAWLEGEHFDLPEEKFEGFRVRLHSAAEPGLYVTFAVNVCRARNCIAVEKFHFGGDALLSAEWGEIFCEKE